MTENPKREAEDFGELIKYTLSGYVGGIVLGVVLDSLGFHRSAIGQWLVRTLSGEGESLLEGFYAFRQRWRKREAGMAEAYGWGKVAGLAVPWVVDAASRLAGIDVYGLPGFYIPFFYAMSDQVGANASGLLYLRRRADTWGAALSAYLRHPVMLAGLVVILAVPVGLLGARLIGFSPSTQVRTALETIVANLCWVPPLVGAVLERKG